MESYSAYGLTIESDLPLPDLPFGRGGADVQIRFGQVSRPAEPADPGIQCLAASPGTAHLGWRSVGELLIEGGDHMTVMPARGVEEDALRLLVMGAGLGVLLHQRGLLVLHGSGVLLGQRAVGFLGGKGSGKSTTAMAVHQRGHPLISDELLAMQVADESAAGLLPSMSPVKLWSDSMISTGRDPSLATAVRSGLDKYYVSTPNMTREVLPLGRIYILGGGPCLSMKPVSTSEAFFGILPHVYVSRFGTAFLQATGAANTFRLLNILLKTTAVTCLQRQKDLGQLAAIAQLVEEHGRQ